MVLQRRRRPLLIQSVRRRVDEPLGIQLLLHEARLQILNVSDVFEVPEKIRLADLLQLLECPLGRAEAPPILLSVFLDLGANISRVLTPDQAFQELAQLLQLSVFWIPDPSHDFDAVLRLSFEVVADVVDDDGPAEVAAQEAQILDEDAVIELAVVSVESVVDEPGRAA